MKQKTSNSTNPTSSAAHASPTFYFRMRLPHLASACTGLLHAPRPHMLLLPSSTASPLLLLLHLCFYFFSAFASAPSAASIIHLASLLQRREQQSQPSSTRTSLEELTRWPQNNRLLSSTTLNTPFVTVFGLLLLLILRLYF